MMQYTAAAAAGTFGCSSIYGFKDSLLPRKTNNLFPQRKLTMSCVLLFFFLYWICVHVENTEKPNRHNTPLMQRPQKFEFAS